MIKCLAVAVVLAAIGVATGSPAHADPAPGVESAQVKAGVRLVLPGHLDVAFSNLGTVGETLLKLNECVRTP